MRHLLSFFFSKTFWLNLLAMFLLSGVLLLAAFKLLDAYTHHGESIIVPDLKGFDINEVKQQLARQNLRYEVMDSTYVKDTPPGAIVDQHPAPGLKVKVNRRIYLTLNTNNPPKVKMPDIKFATLRNAQAQLESIGLDVKDTEYIDDPARNAVLGVKLDGQPLEAGTEVTKGTAVILVLGNGGGGLVPVPQLVDLTYAQAKIMIVSYGLNEGVVVVDPDVTDREHALVYQQVPEAIEEATMMMGEPMDLFLKENPNKDDYIIEEEEIEIPVPEPKTAPAKKDAPEVTPPAKESTEKEVIEQPSAAEEKEKTPTVDPLKALEKLKEKKAAEGE